MDYLEKHFESLVKAKEQMKEIQVDKKIIAELTGRMLIQEEIIGIEQASIIKKELNLSEHFKFDGTLWNYYNNCTQALKSSKPITYIKDHVNLHEFIEKEFALV